MPGLENGDLVAERYEIVRALGKGGMGVVYLAKDNLTEQMIALKTLLPEYVANRRAVQRFIQEVNAVRRLDHDCIVKILDARQLDNLLYYTMEYVEGKSLREWMQRKKRFGIGSTVRVLSLLCSALEHAHQYTIHRDISPENVMVMANGDVKLLDFGLAKLTDSNASFTRVGVSLGKIQYSAPEQRVDAKNVDQRADLYSLGVMFYEMLGRQLPKPGVQLTSLAPELPLECDTFVERAMADDPDERFSSAKEFREALMRVYEISKLDRDEMKRNATTMRPASSNGTGFFGRIRNALTGLIPGFGKRGR